MMQVSSKDGSKIAYDSLGSGPLLVYITGAICHRNFKPVLDDAKFFSQDFTVINYDRRGRGDSQDIQPYSLQKEIDDIEALIDAVGTKVNLYGHSSGAVLALEAGLRLANKIDKIFIYDPAYVAEEAEKANYVHMSREVNALLAKKEYSQALRSFLTGIGMPKFFVFLLPIMPGWKKLKALAPTLAYDLELTKDEPPYKLLGGLSVPITIAYGQKSPSSMKAVSKGIHAVVSGSQLIEVPEQDHMVSAKVLLPLFKKFL